MPSLLFYLIKLTVALAAVYLIYQLVLRRLTFYNWNRWYLIVYTLLAFFIPFIDITPVLQKNEWSDTRLVNWVPVINENTPLQNINADNTNFSFSAWNIMTIIMISGMLFLFTRLFIQFISFNRMKKKALRFTENGLTVYQVNDDIIPFSFGNSIFINRQLHTEEELQEIIRHEFIHVKQKHSIDILWAELLCLLNWYNPFAWLLKRSIRQNLEFIADNKVIETGINKKEYQYLLLKVIGNNQFSIATQFNFSSLKKRIAMMNKTKSAKRQLLRMLFLVPATAILLLAFRNKLNESNDTSALNNNLAVSNIAIKQQENISDTIPSDNPPKDYKEFLKRNPQIENIKWSGGPFSMTINLKNGSKETYDLENKKEIAGLEKKYGKLPPGPPLVAGSVKEVEVTEESSREVEELADVKEVTVKEVPVKVVTADPGVVFVTGISLKKAISTTGELKEVTVVGKPLTKTIATNPDLQEIVVTGVPLKKAVSTTGEIKEVTAVGKPLTKTIATNPDLQEVVVAGFPSKKAVSTTGELKEVTIVGKPAKAITTNPDINEVTVVGKPSKVSTTVKSDVLLKTKVAGTTIASTDQTMIGDVDISITIKNTAKPEDLESFINKLKDKGYELKFDNKDYDDGILKNLSGTIKYKGSISTFSFTDFDEATIKVYRDGDKVNFKIYTGKRKVTS